MKIVRFLHASDFQLQQPAVGFGSGTFAGALYPEVPDEVRRDLEDAAWESAVRCFDAALEHQVDFLLLTGNILSPEQTGPRGLVFLLEQFRRLDEAGIPIYWKGTEPAGSWALPEGTLPGNVFLFPPGETLIRKYRPQDESRTLFLLSWDGDEPDWTRYDLSKLPGEKLPPRWTVALRNEAAGDFPAAYVARGGSAMRQTRSYTAALSDCVEHAPGTIQGRSPDVLDFSGQEDFGATLVKLDWDGEVPLKLEWIPLETVAWRGIRLNVPESVRTEADLGGWLETKLPALGAIPDSVRRVLLYWKLHSDHPAGKQLLRTLFCENLQPDLEMEARQTARLLERLRQAGGVRRWSVSLETDDELLPADWLRSESIPGDFLRLARFHRNNPRNTSTAISVPGFTSHTLDLGSYLSEAQRRDDIAAVGNLPNAEDVLRDAEIFGASLLYSTDDSQKPSDRP